MSVRTRLEIRTHLRDVSHETNINDLIDAFINLTLMEINDPAWAFENVKAMRGMAHHWSFNRRKHTFATVADQEDYPLPRDIDYVNLVRQTTSPVKLKQIPDHKFYKYVPNPEASGNPIWYRLWEEEGLATRLSTDDTLTIVSSSASDTSSISIVLSGYDTDGIKRSEVLFLNGTTLVNGTITFDAGRPVRVSKSANTVGRVTVAETTATTTLLIIGEHERSPRFKLISLYPIPSAAITMYVEYYTRIRALEHDGQVPDIDEKWIWVVVQGTLAKIRDYQGKEAQLSIAQRLYEGGVRSMVKADLSQPDIIPVLERHDTVYTGKVEMGDENFSLTY